MVNLDSVYKSYGAIKTLENVTIGIERGKSLCIVGPSGSGKSTLLKIMALITKPDKGIVTIDGTEANDAKDLDQLRSSVVSYSFQESLLLPYLGALDNIVCILSPITDKKEQNPTNHLEKEAKVILSRLGLSNRMEHYPSQLSVGEKKRVDLARAVLKGSKLLIADEPLSNLDPDTGGLVVDLFREYTQNGGTVVYSSVNPSESRHADSTYSILRAHPFT